MQRLQQLEKWLNEVLGHAGFRLEPASSDASFRRYFRVFDGERTLIAMDAPPPQENCRPFVHVAQLFGAAGVHTPEILAQDLERGFLLLPDFGGTTYLDALTPDNATALYSDALDALIRIQLASQPDTLAPYDRALLTREMELFPTWYVTRHRGKSWDAEQQAQWNACLELILENNLAQPQVYVHRDYHARNLMVTTPNPGVLDFQDAVYGPITYDLVSLLKDAYIHWEEPVVLDLVIRYWERARAAGLPVNPDFSLFYRDFEWMGVQRHLKVLGIFARLYHRDGKDGYLKDLPLVALYLRKACERYQGLGPLLRLLNEADAIAEGVGYTF